MVKYHKKRGKKTIWVETDCIGEYLFTFDKQTIYNLYEDYPWKLTPEERPIFDEENPEWADSFADRK